MRRSSSGYLPATNEDWEDTDERPTSAQRNQGCTNCRPKNCSVTVEPVLFCSMIIIVLYSMVEKEFIFASFAEQYGLKNETENGCNKSDTNMSDPHQELEDKVSQMTTKWVLYLNVAVFTVSSVTSVFLGALSDKIGRKIPLNIGLLGFVALNVTYIVVISLDLPVPWLLVGHFLNGLSGGFGIILASCFAYLSEISSPERRTFRMGIGEASVGFGACLAGICGGYWIKSRGFLEPFWFLFGISVFSIIYVMIFLEETVVRNEKSFIRKTCTVQPFIDIFHLVSRGHGTKRNIKILLYTLCILLVITQIIGVQDVLIIFEIGLPFCWSYTLAGYEWYYLQQYNIIAILTTEILLFSISTSLLQTGYFISLGFLRIFRTVTAEVWLVGIDFLSNVSMSFALTFASKSWHIVLGVCLKFAGYIAAPVIRSHVSKIVSPNELGAVFSLLSFAQNLSGLLAAFLYNGIFAITVKTAYPGAVFSVGIALYVVHAVLFCIAYHMSKDTLLAKNEAENEYRTIVET